jgi:hypothetical protein
LRFVDLSAGQLIQTLELNMNWNTILTTLGSIGIGAGALAWLVKKFLSQLLEKDIEKFKSTLQFEAQKQLIEYGSLHKRRAELISELYEKLSQVDLAAQLLPWQLQLREYKEEYGQQNKLLLEQHEKEKVEDLSSKWRDMSQFYTKNKIYFNPAVCELIDKFQTLTGFISVNYENVAFKDDDGNLYVNPNVKRVWDAAHQSLPEAKLNLEKEFREILGVQ